ncbi:hypothetical protein PCE1_002476 [Barthelona sp. PCE]
MLNTFGVTEDEFAISQGKTKLYATASQREKLSVRSGARARIFLNPSAKNTSKNEKKESYSGEWLNNAMHGYGEYGYRDGSVYVGSFHQNCRSGIGSLYIPDEHGKLMLVYEGHWEKDHFDGAGTLYTHNEDGTTDVYKGEFSEDLRNGEGYLATEEYVYIGNFRDDMKSGYGVVIYKNGNRFVGEFEMDMKHGEGTYYFYSTQRKLIGLYVEDICKVSSFEDWSEDDKEEFTRYLEYVDVDNLPELVPQEDFRPLPALGLLDPNAVLMAAAEKYLNEEDNEPVEEEEYVDIHEEDDDDEDM